MKIFLIGLLGFAWVTVTLAAVAYHSGACPDGIKVGGSWYKLGCEKCSCIKGAYVCYTCPVMNPPPNCTLRYEYKGNYPDCCKPLVDCPKAG